MCPCASLHENIHNNIIQNWGHLTGVEVLDLDVVDFSSIFHSTCGPTLNTETGWPPN